MEHHRKITISEAKKIGIKNTLYFVNIGVLAAFIIFMLISAGEGMAAVFYYPLSTLSESLEEDSENNPRE